METAKGRTREEIINRLADRIDSFEKYAEPHSRLMAVLASRLARKLGLPASDIDAISEAAMLHDIGLYAMSPAYHSLPRPLSFEAKLDLWRHPVIGEQQMAKRDASRHAQLLVRWHHEWWNGSGYPDMLAFEDIPIGARILRAVELYCALLGDRPYRLAFAADQALETLAASAGLECDPHVVKALLALIDELTGTEQSTQAASIQPFIEKTLNESSDLVDDGGTSRSEPGSRAGEFSHEPERSERETGFAAVPHVEASSPAPRTAELLLTRAQSEDALEVPGQCSGWKPTHYNKKTLLGFQASVLRQIEFRSIAIPYWGDARLDLYLKTWGKIIYANDPRAWAASVARARIECNEPLGEDLVARVLQDVYVPGARLANPELRRWFGETDAWWMDNLRRNIETLEDGPGRLQAMSLGLQTGDYALSFDEETRELRRPLTTIFWRLAGREVIGPAGHANNRSFCQPVEEFIKQARADVLFLSLTTAHPDRGGAEARHDWRESWVTGRVDERNRAAPPQSSQSYLFLIDRLLRHASNFRTWAIEHQEPGLASAQDLVDLIKEYRAVRATYSKDVTEVAGGLRSYIIVGERSGA